MEEKTTYKSKVICDAICGILMLLCIISYICVGLFAKVWHPTWIILVGGAVACGIIGIINSTVINMKEVNNKSTK